MKNYRLPKHLPLILLLTCVIVYFASLFSDALFDGARGNSIPGYTLLLMGWIGVFYGMPAWGANPLLVVSLFLFKKSPTVSKRLALVGFFIGATVLPLRRMVLDEGGSPVDFHLEMGYYLWLTCFPLAFLASHFRSSQGR